MKFSNPVFSVIIPTYNSEKTIGRCIESVVSQIFQDFEIIVVDNFSSDSTLKIIESFQGNIKIICEHNHGVIAHSRNLGILSSSGDWICFLDSDDWWASNKLLEVYKNIENYDVIYHDLKVKYSSFQILGLINKIGRRYDYKDIVRDILINGNFAPTSSISIRKSILFNVGLLSEDERMVAVEDTDCYIKIAVITRKWKYISKSLGYYWIASNTSLSCKQIEREGFLYRAHLDRLDDNDKKLAELYYTLKKARIFHKTKQFNLAINEYKEYLRLNKTIKITFLMFLAKVKVAI